MADTQREIAFEELGAADLIVDAIYKGGSFGDVRDDPIAPLVGGGNQGGFRYLGKPSLFEMRHCVLYSALSDLDWPDTLDPETGRFTYYGDNKTPGSEIHGTTRRGNLLLRQMFDALHSDRRDEIPPTFVFTKGATGRDVVFRGLAVPGAPGVMPSDDLVALWRTKGDQRFQNYRAVFTILDIPRIERKWIDDIRSGASLSAHAPTEWESWRRTGSCSPLMAPRVKDFRTPAEQIPESRADLGLLESIVAHYASHPDGPYAFERCAAELFRLLDPKVREVDLTRPWRDGGRDALGLYQIGDQPSGIKVEFALEAKCKAPSAGNSSGVRETARLVARIRHRQFGVFVTTSCVGNQAYRELVEDGHPVLVVSGRDIVRILRHHGLGSPEALAGWLAKVDAQ